MKRCLLILCMVLSLSACSNEIVPDEDAFQPDYAKPTNPPDNLLQPTSDPP